MFEKPTMSRTQLITEFMGLQDAPARVSEFNFDAGLMVHFQFSSQCQGHV